VENKSGKMKMGEVIRGRERRRRKAIASFFLRNDGLVFERKGGVWEERKVMTQTERKRPPRGRKEEVKKE
jgi:hypothetical protein